MWLNSQQPKTWTNGVDLYDVDDENRQHIERHSQQIEEGEANERRVHLISFRRTVVQQYNKIAMLSLNERSVESQNLLYCRTIVWWCDGRRLSGLNLTKAVFASRTLLTGSTIKTQRIIHNRTQQICTIVVFYPCQWNLTKTFQTEANTPLITKMAMKIFLNIFDRSY